MKLPTITISWRMIVGAVDFVRKWRDARGAQRRAPFGGATMATVRAKFRLNSYTTELHNSYPHKKADGTPDYQKIESVEKRTLNFTPVMGSDASPENRAFWDATPSGSLQLGVVNKSAWDAFILGREYYLDFTLAE